MFKLLSFVTFITERVRVTWPILEFYKTSLEWLKLDFVHGLATRSTNLYITNCPPGGRGQGYVAHFRILHPLKYLQNGLSYSRQILCNCRPYQVLVFGQPTISGRRVAPVTWPIFEFYTPLNFSGMSEGRIIKFCAQVGPRSISLVMTNCPLKGRGKCHVTL